MSRVGSFGVQSSGVQDTESSSPSFLPRISVRGKLRQESRETKDWIPHQVRNDNNKDGDINGMSLRGAESDEAISQIPLRPPLLKGETIPLFSKEGIGEITSPIQLASLTTDNLLKNNSQHPGEQRGQPLKREMD
jgi:hypothetical protein